MEELKETIKNSGPTFSASVSKELSQSSNEVLKLQSMLASKSYSHFVANEHMCNISKKVSAIHSRAVDYSKEVSVARDAKSVALTRMVKQEDNYSKACSELDKLLHKLDEALAHVNTHP